MDSDCSDSDKCIRSHCVQACQVDMCGVNAICNAQGHHAICSCPSQYEGNPHIECSKGMQLFVECVIIINFIVSLKFTYVQMYYVSNNEMFFGRML